MSHGNTYFDFPDNSFDIFTLNLFSYRLTMLLQHVFVISDMITYTKSSPVARDSSVKLRATLR